MLAELTRAAPALRWEWSVPERAALGRLGVPTADAEVVAYAERDGSRWKVTLEAAIGDGMGTSRYRVEGWAVAEQPAAALSRVLRDADMWALAASCVLSGLKEGGQ